MSSGQSALLPCSRSCSLPMVGWHRLDSIQDIHTFRYCAKKCHDAALTLLQGASLPMRDQFDKCGCASRTTTLLATKRCCWQCEVLCRTWDAPPAEQGTRHLAPTHCTNSSRGLQRHSTEQHWQTSLFGFIFTGSCVATAFALRPIALAEAHMTLTTTGLALRQAPLEGLQHTELLASGACQLSDSRSQHQQ